MTNSTKTKTYRVTEHGDVTNYYATANEAAAYRDEANGYRRHVLNVAGSFVVQSYDRETDEWTEMVPQPTYRARGRRVV